MSFKFLNSKVLSGAISKSKAITVKKANNELSEKF